MSIPIDVVHENIFSLYPDVLVHAVSAVGLMRDNFSRQLKRAYPDYFREYSRLSLRKHLVAGSARVFSTGTLLGTRYVVLWVIKDHWHHKLQAGLMKIAIVNLWDVLLAIEDGRGVVAIPHLEEAPTGWLQTKLISLATDKGSDAYDGMLLYPP